MAKKSLVIIAFLISISAFAQNTASGTPSGIQFEHNKAWKEIVKKAKAENKLIFMDAYTTWCGPCKMLQVNIFPNKDLGEFFNKNFVNAKIDMETDEGMRLASIYPVKGYPNMFFIDPNTGKVVKDYLGYPQGGVPELMNIAQNVVKKNKKG